jgi:HEAT repeat protein
MGIFGPPNIKKLKEKVNINGLIGAFKKGDKEIKSKVVEALVEIGNDIAVEFLYNTLKDKNEMDVLCTIDGVIKLGNSRAFSALLELFKRDIEYYLLPVTGAPKGAAAIGLVSIDKTKAFQPLLAALIDSNSKLELLYEGIYSKNEDPIRKMAEDIMRKSESVFRAQLSLAFELIGDQKAVNAIEELIAKERDPNVLSVARISLKKLKEQIKE